MSKFQIHFIPTNTSKGKVTVLLRLVNSGCSGYLPLKINLTQFQWQEIADKESKKGIPNRMEHVITLEKECVMTALSMLKASRKAYGITEITKTYHAFSTLGKDGFCYFATKLIASNKTSGKFRLAETYRTSIHSFLNYRQGKDIKLKKLDREIVEDYESWLKLQNKVPNTISFYLRNLRAIYNRAVDKGLVDARNPFRNVYTGIDKTVKRAISLKEIKKLRILDLSVNPKEEFARDMFILSFLLRGMSFVDLTYLKKTDLKNGVLTYRRKKTAGELKILWTVEMQKILDKYQNPLSPYLLPILSEKSKNERATYKKMSFIVNRNLKKIGERIGMKTPLTMYVARHSWASGAQAMGIPISVISQGMGHDSEATTRIYLASLSNEVIDEANDLITGSIF